MSADTTALDSDLLDGGSAADDSSRADEERYGWVIVGLAFIVLALTCGLTFYSMSAYINALVGESGFSLAVASAGPTMSAVLGGVGGLVTVRLMRALPLRTLLMIGAVGMSASTAAIGASHTWWQLWGAFALSGWFAAMVSGIPISALVARWFPAAPARPLTLAMTGLAFGGAVIPPVVLALLNGYGLTKGSVFIGIGLLVLVSIAIFFMKEPPAHLAPAPRSAMDDHLRPSFGNKLFVLLFVGFMFLVMSQVATTAHIVRMAHENGIGAAGLAVSCLAIGSLSGRLAGIPLLPILGLKRLMICVGILQGASQFVLSTAHSEIHLLIGALMMGLAMGNVVILMSLFAIEAYGLIEYPRMFSRLNLAGPLASGFGPLVVGILHGTFGGYEAPIMLMGAGSWIGAICLAASGVDTARKWGGLTPKGRQRQAHAMEEQAIEALLEDEAQHEGKTLGLADGVSDEIRSRPRVELTS
jgi:MFS family permease